MIGGGLALSLDQDGDTLGILSVPGLEWLENLKAVAGGGDGHVDLGPVLGGGLVGVTAGVVSLFGQSLSSWCLEHEFFAILALKGIGQRVEVEGTGEGHGDNEVRGGDESVGGGVGVVTASEVAVVRRDDGVSLALLDIATIPLSNARTAGVGENDATEFLKGLQLAITLNSSTNLLGARGDGEQGLSLETVVHGVLGNGGGTGHILVGGVGARADQTDLQLGWPVVLLDSILELGDGSSQVGSEGSVDMGLEFAQVDLDELIVFRALILTETLSISSGKIANGTALGSLQVVVHAVVIWENGSSSTNFSTHVANGTHTSAGERLDTRSVVLNDGTSTALDGKNTSNLENDI